MKELSRAMFRVGMASALFGARQMTGLLSAKRKHEGDHTAEVLNSVASTLVDECDEPLRDTFDVADKVQRELVDTALRAFAPGTRTNGDSASGSITGLMRQALTRMGEMMGGISSGGDPGHQRRQSEGRSAEQPQSKGNAEPSDPGVF